MRTPLSSFFSKTSASPASVCYETFLPKFYPNSAISGLPLKTSDCARPSGRIRIILRAARGRRQRHGCDRDQGRLNRRGHGENFRRNLRDFAFSSATSRRNSSMPLPAKRISIAPSACSCDSLFLLKTRRMASMVGSSSSSGRKSVNTAASVGKLPSPPPTSTLNPRREVPLLPRTCAMSPTSWIPATAQSPSFSQPEKAILNLRGKS